MGETKSEIKEISVKEYNRRIIDNNFTYHPPVADQQIKYQELRAKAKELAYVIEGYCPSYGKEKALAMDALEEAVMWANAAIARHTK